MAFVLFLSSAVGRVLRIVVGLGLLGWGIFLATETSTMTIGIILAVVGLLPLGAGLADVCVFAPLFGAPFSGAKVRAHGH
jgi:hypothetical protein